MPDLYFTSAKNYLKRFMYGTESVAAPASAVAWGFQTTLTVTHNLGYIPQVRVYFEDSASDNKVYPAGGRRLSGIYPGLPFNSIYCLFEVDTTELRIYLTSATSKTGSRNVHYVIYADNV